jgi:23S rRNA pseudouridine1911/1915/1917 synthase
METEKDGVVNNITPMAEPVVLFEDSSVLVVSKPYGMLVHEDWGSGSEGTLVDWFLKKVPSAKGVGEQTVTAQGKVLERSGVVHRLDRETSGVMVLAKTAEAHAHLKAQFHDRLAKKEYRAFVYGRMHDRWGTIDRPIGRSAQDFKLRSAQRGARGTLRPAVTDWERIASGEYNGEIFSYLKLIPKTGRTHQLRVHLKANDRPIVQDPLYSGKLRLQSNNLGLDRLALHAHVLEIELPSGQVERFIAPVPHEFELAAERLESNM